jgi:hypothetical protein
MVERPVGRIRFMDEQRVNLDGFAREDPALGLVALRSPADPAPSLRVVDGVVVELDQKARDDLDTIDRYIAAHGLDLTVADEAMALGDVAAARLFVDPAVPRAEVVRLVAGMTPAKLARVVAVLRPAELMMAMTKLRGRRTPSNQAHVTNLLDDPLLLAADAATAAYGFRELETTVPVLANAVAVTVGAAVGAAGVLVQCAVEEAMELEMGMRGLVSYAETVSLYGTEGVFIDGTPTPVRRPGPGIGRAVGRARPHGPERGRRRPARRVVDPRRASRAVVVDLGGGTIDVVSATGATTLAGAGELLTAATAAVLGVASTPAEWAKRGPAARVEAPQLLLAEDGTRTFLDAPIRRDAIGALVVPGPTGWLPFGHRLAPAEWRALRLRLKTEILGANLTRALPAARGRSWWSAGPRGTTRSWAASPARCLPAPRSAGRTRPAGWATVTRSPTAWCSAWRAGPEGSPRRGGADRDRGAVPAEEVVGVFEGFAVGRAGGAGDGQQRGGDRHVQDGGLVAAGRDDLDVFHCLVRPDAVMGVEQLVEGAAKREFQQAGESVGR